MRDLVHVVTIGVLSCLWVVTPAKGQDESQLKCGKEKGPVGSYCSDLEKFFSDGVKATKDGKVDRTNSQLLSELRTILVVDSDPGRFVSFIAPDVALRDALGALENSPDVSSAISQATLTSANQNRPD